MTVAVAERNGRVELQSPYHPSLPASAKRIGGRWDAEQKVWWFDTRDGDSVRRLACRLYGTDGAPTETVTVRYTLHEFDGNDGALWKYGRQLARRRSRDEAVQLGDNVIIVSGRFPGSGGSRAHPALCGGGVTLEVRDVPVSLINDDDVVVAEGQGPDQAMIRARIAELEAELARLRAQLQEA